MGDSSEYVYALGRIYEQRWQKWNSDYWRLQAIAKNLSTIVLEDYVNSMGKVKKFLSKHIHFGDDKLNAYRMELENRGVKI